MLGTDLYHIVHWFLIYSILGWAIESIYMSICNRKLTNRGFMKGPFCPIYGAGALTVLFILKPFAGNYVALYLVGALLATTFEFLVAKMMIFLFGSVWWDYNDKPFNYKGILCLESTLAWGLYTIVMFGALHRFVMWLVGRYPFKIGIILGKVVLFVAFVDMFAHIYKEKKEFFNESFEGIREKWRGIRPQ